MERKLVELHQRLASPLLTIAFTLISLAAILVGEFNRRGLGRRILIAGLAIVATQAVFMSLNGVIARNLWLSFILYMTALVPALIGLGLVNAERLKGRIFLPKGIEP
jgi:lipopolysaccharide export system permease protein